MRFRGFAGRAALAVAVLAASFWIVPSAFAGVHVGIGLYGPGYAIGINNGCWGCGYGYGYVAPPVYYAPAYPAPVYYYPPAYYYGPRPIYYGYGYYAPRYRGYYHYRRHYGGHYYHRGYYGHRGGHPGHYYHHGHR